MRLIECKVTKELPDIELEGTNDDKLKIKTPLIVVPQHLTDQEYPCYIETEAYTSKNTKVGEGPFTHDVCAASGHTCPPHYYKTGWICMHNHLVEGDKVYVLELDGGKAYYILDRVPPDKETMKSHHKPCPYDE
ncbi:MAG: DUF2577 domain-containing protein [Muribaculaceae bacterium]|nr:DUF2577 domain-containing protein [Muribaculaceae bacterium]